MENQKYRFLELDEVAEMLHMDTEEFIDRLKQEGYIDGNTQSMKAFRLKLFHVDQSVQRWRGGLYHGSKFHIRVKPKGVQHFLREFGTMD